MISITNNIDKVYITLTQYTTLSMILIFFMQLLLMLRKYELTITLQDMYDFK